MGGSGASKLVLNFSQVNGNTANGGPMAGAGGIANINLGPVAPGAVNGGVLAITASQIRGNTAGQGGGIFAVPGSPATLKLTLIARNTPDNCAPPGSVMGCKNREPGPARSRPTRPIPGRGSVEPAGYQMMSTLSRRGASSPITGAPGSSPDLSRRGYPSGR
jgi:hypothetical protein